MCIGALELNLSVSSKTRCVHHYIRSVVYASLFVTTCELV